MDGIAPNVRMWDKMEARICVAAAVRPNTKGEP